MGLAWLALNAALTLYCGGRLLDRFAAGLSRAPERLLALYLTCVGLLVALTLALGWLGVFSPLAVTGVTLLLAAVLHFALPRQGARWLELASPRCWRVWWNAADWLERTLAIVLGLFLGATFIFAAISPAVDPDTTGYRLSRVGLWWTTGAIEWVQTSDPRMNYSPHNADAMMLWTTSVFSVGYPLVKLTQWLAGASAALTVFCWGRTLGFSRTLGFAGGLLTLSAPLVMAQMMTAQVDIAAMAWLNTGLFFLYRSLRTGEGMWLGWLGVFLGVGAKVTVLFWGPGLALAFGASLLLSKPTKSQWVKHALAALIFGLLFALPRYAQTQAHYGHFLGQRDHVDRFSVEEQSMFSSERMSLNLRTMLAQAMVQGDSLPPLDWMLSPLAGAMMDSLPPKRDAHADAYRLGFLEMLRDREIPRQGHLYGTVGALPFLLFVAGLLALVVRWRKEPKGERFDIGGLFVSVVLFYVVMAGMFLWFLANSRFMAVALPTMLLVSLYPWRKSRLAVWMIAGLALATTAWNGYQGMLVDHATGYRGLQLNDERTSSRRQAGLESVVSELLPTGGRIVVATHYYTPLSVFYRTGKGLDIVLLTLDEAGEYESPKRLMEAFDADGLVASAELFAQPDTGLSMWGMEVSTDPQDRFSVFLPSKTETEQ